MTRTGDPPASLSTLVDELVAYLQDQPKLRETSELNLPPEQLARVFETFGHHLVALTLVSRSDADVAAAEREVILRHCMNLAEAAGLAMTSAEEEALSEYLRQSHPTMQQLTPMLDRLRNDTKEEIAVLIDVAHALVEADGVVRLQELAYVASLQRDLRAL